MRHRTHIRYETNSVEVSGQVWVMERYQMREHCQVLYM